MRRDAPGAEPGTYALLLRAGAEDGIRIGRLGVLDPVPQWSLYVGSAHGPGGLRGRLGHHLRSASRPRWHVDWLRRRAEVDEVWWTPDRRRREHDWATCLAARPDATVPLPGFGSTDCGCRTHLLGFRRRPSASAFRRRLLAAHPDHGGLSVWRPPSALGNAG